MKKEYEKILHSKHFESRTHRRMQPEKRAAQFAPFAALVGFEDSIREKARITDSKIEVPEFLIEDIDRKILYLKKIISKKPQISVEYFVKDNLKNGGAYLTYTGNLKKIDDYSKDLVFDDGTVINIKEISDVKILDKYGDIFID